MSSTIFDSMEQILDRFDEAWNAPTPPCIEDYLAAGDPNHRLALLIELVRIDLERRLAGGEKVRLEDPYLRRFPELFADSPAIVTLVKHEYDCRRFHEPDLKFTEYLERFPQCQTELLAQLPTLNDDLDGERQPERAEIPLTGSEPAELDLRRYELIQALGKGGMGEVYRCCDPALGRDLAIKVMNTDLRSHPEVERRFLREARITGSLQHPGIVPVHNLGRLPDGRLHYTMRLVRGRTFAAILKDEAGKPERLPFLLGIFEKICQAAAYAHSKRVIHRDLKPANVMVGKFGEVQVMDWGLAKLLSTEGESAHQEPRTEVKGTLIHTEAADTPSDLTRAGSGLGTPAYMSPEQALGELDTVDERTDVFALGAILCEMLTGQPPYGGQDGNEALRRARRGDLMEALARLETCEADEALKALCRDCLASECRQRPRDAGTMAQRVAAYQAEVQERLRRAELERAAAVVKARAERKQRRLILASVLVLAAAAVVTSWLALRATQAADAERLAREAEFEQRRQAEEQKRKAETNAQEAKHQKEIAEAQKRQTEQQAAIALAVNDFLLKDLLGKSDIGQQMVGPREQRDPDVKVRTLLDRASRSIEGKFKDQPLTEAAIRLTIGEAYRALGRYAESQRHLERSLQLRTAQLGADHPDTLTSKNDLASLYQDQSKYELAEPLFKEVLQKRTDKLGADHPDTLSSKHKLAALYQELGMYKDQGKNDLAERLYKEVLQTRTAKLGADHPATLSSKHSLATLYLDQGWLYKDQSKYGLAEPLFKEVLQGYTAKLGADHPATLSIKHNLALLYFYQGKYELAEPLYKEVLQTETAKLGADHPSTLTSKHNLALLYRDQGKYGLAEPLFKEVLQALTAKLGADHPETLVCKYNLALLYYYQGKYGLAQPLYKDVLQACMARLGADHPRTLICKHDLAGLYRDQGKYALAEPLFKEALQGRTAKLGADHLATLDTMAGLCLNLLRQKRYADAEPMLRDCLAICAKKQPDLWTTFDTRSMLGEALAGQKKYAEAEPLLVQGCQGMKQRQDKVPPAYRQLRLTEMLEHLVQLYEATDQKEKAADWRKKLEEIRGNNRMSDEPEA